MKKILFFVVLSMTCGYTMAQARQSAAMPKLTSSWGRTGSGNLSMEQVIRLTDSSLNVRDEKGNAWAVAGFRINYSFLSTYRDQESGEVKTTKELRTYDFNDTTALNTLWKESIRDNVKAGDEILFNKITARQKNGKKYFAPDLRFKVTE
jgi:hypothetical protein